MSAAEARRYARRGYGMSNNIIEYEDRMVAFIDILGWRNIVERSVEDSDLRQRMLAGFGALELRAFDPFTIDFREFAPKDLFCTMSQISDTVILSRSANTWPFWFTIELGILARVMMAVGFVVRGGVTIGKMYHEGTIAVGPALTRAYMLESEVALYPRIVIDPVHAERFCVSDREDSAFELHTIRSGLDGLWFINFLHPMFANPSDFPHVKLLEFREFLQQSLIRSANQPRISEKYSWLTKYFDTLVAEFPSAGVMPIGDVT